jgi:hypothetical protein
MSMTIDQNRNIDFQSQWNLKFTLSDIKNHIISS